MSDITTSLPISNLAQLPPPVTKLSSVSGNAGNGSGLGFGDIVDALNPLQHIPVVSGIYRAVMGSSISSASQVVGDTLYGGLLGGAAVSLASSLANVAVKQVTGADISQHVVATVDAATTSSTSLPGATKLTLGTSVPTPASTDAQTAPASNTSALAAKAADAASVILHRNLHDKHANGQYQRAQALSATQSALLKAL